MFEKFASRIIYCKVRKAEADKPYQGLFVIPEDWREGEICIEGATRVRIGWKARNPRSLVGVGEARACATEEPARSILG